MAQIKNIIFDLCGPIITIDINLIDDKLRSFGVRGENLYRQLFDAGLTKRFESGQITTEEFCNELRVILNTGISNEQICDAWNTLILDFKKSHQTLIRNVRKNYNTFLFSNSDVVNAEYFVEFLNREAGFDFTGESFNEAFFSYQIGDRKPSEKAFRYILSRHNLKAEETLFIDDCEKHCIGAGQLGLNTLWLKKKTDLCELFDSEGKLKVGLQY